MSWFDHNATAPLAPEARAAWLDASDNRWQNPSSPTAPSARVHARLEQCRERVAALFDEHEKEVVVFNSGATEGNNAVFASEAAKSGSGRLLVSAVEHPSVLEPAKKYFGDRLTVVPADGEGRLDLIVFESELKKGGVTLVSVMAANNETGVLQPWMQAARLAAAHGAKTHCDATQWLGRLPLAGLAHLDYVTAGGHKIGAPKGVGVLLVRRCNRDFRGLLGGAQENGRRAGTENLPGVIGFLAALEAANAELMPMLHERLAWRAAFEAAVVSAIPGADVIGAHAERLWNTVSIKLPRHANTRWVARLDKRGFQISTGSACATGSGKSSHVLASMGFSEDEIRRTVRVSSGRFTTEADWVALAAAFAEVFAELDADAGGSSVITI
jgi:cysteine desulfurase